MRAPCEFCSKNCGRPWCYTNQKAKEKDMKVRTFKSFNWLGNSFGFFFYRNKLRNKLLDCGLTIHINTKTYGIVLTF